MDGGSLTIASKPRWLSGLLYVGPILLFAAATAFGVLEVHSSTDTWIGLAAGRQILTADEFPKHDTFSYTFCGEVWYNQNWLTHLFQYCLYCYLSPNAVIYGTWAMSASVFVLALLAAYWRSGTWLGALLAASAVALGCRDFLSARPATTGFFCIAALWALLCALEGQREKRRWWPIVLLLPLLLLWGNAHGSFVFGYGILLLYIGHWFVVRTIGVRHSWTFSLAAPLLAILVGGILSPRQVELLGQALVDAILGLRHALGGALSDQRVEVDTTAALRGVVVAGALVTYAAYWGCIRYFRPRLAIRDRQIAALAGVVGAALVLTVILGPFGIHNFTHGQKVVGSEVFRQVSEWHPPTDPGKHFPPVRRFWIILRVSLGMLLACALVFLATRGKPTPAPAKASRPAHGERGRPATRTDPRAEPSELTLHTSLFDVALVAIGLSMTFWARRFAPIYFIFGGPVFLTWVVLLLRPLPARLRSLWTPLPHLLRASLMAAAGIFALYVADQTWARAYDGIVRPFVDQPQFNLLERVTRYDMTPHEAILFLKENKLNVNLLVEWTQAGPVMFYAPNAKVFMDGRAQQVYDEMHYMRYTLLLANPDTPRPLMMRTLNEHQTDAVLLRRMKQSGNLWMALQQSGQWVPVLLGIDYGLFLRKDSRGLAQLGELLRRGEEWRPNTAPSLASRGLVWQATTPPDLEQALACWQAALRQNVLTGSLSFPLITEALLELGRPQEARQFVEEHYQKLSQPVAGISGASRRELLKILRTCWDDIETATAGKPADDAKD
jgi:hypothetical protein